MKSSKSGFTLIELLVVIGILAVLAAIAIPSVAGLIDRANVSSDQTNANEMTNAIERFASEYELYLQDIASGAITAGQQSGFDAAQGRVYNVTKATTRTDIENIEKPDTAKTEDTKGIAIYRDTKYPVNAETTKAIIENYTKTSISTFEPKQSDMNYWYSPDCGIVVYAEPNASKDALNGTVVSGMDAKGNPLNEDTQWINLTLDTPAGSGDADLSNVDTVLANNDWATIQAVAKAGKATEVGWRVGDISPDIILNGVTYNARIIGINQDGSNTISFMFTSSIGHRAMNYAPGPFGCGDITGGFKDADMNTWLNNTIFKATNADFQAAVCAVNKKSNVLIDGTADVTSASYNLFLLSVKEAGLKDELMGDPYYTDALISTDWLDAESAFVYQYFETDDATKRASVCGADNCWWLRSCGLDDWWNAYYCSQYGALYEASANLEKDDSGNGMEVVPAFVVG